MTRGKQLRTLRKGLEMTQKDLAKRSGVDVSTISRFENDLIAIQLDTYELLLKGLGCQIRIERIKEEQKR